MKIIYQLDIKLILIFIFFLSFPITVYADVMFIGNNTESVPDDLTLNQIEMIFLGKMKFWNNGSEIVVVVNTNKSIHGKFAEKFTGKSSRNFKIHWRKLVFTGEAEIPKGLNNDNNVILYIRKTPGAIGYVSENNQLSGVKKIKIIK